MGYYTNYSMEVLDIDNKGYNSYEIAKFMFNEKENFDKFYAFENELSEFIKDIDVKEGINYKLSLDSVGEYKWYSHEEEMLLLSKKFPNVLFKLHGGVKKIQIVGTNTLWMVKCNIVLQK